ncbi:O-antigen ligase family protein [Patulibacter sp.]|uniref:O-antigen ligase family protein n=1 Tax=Patulibacter sp. TaxID=1912859 RepID=UPI00271CE88D|nr:O-antigen ligase family protein [Patulibacter sp.]MDO9410778.1 O-antigen ligase family protein [Patulibacter sp.]
MSSVVTPRSALGATFPRLALPVGGFLAGAGPVAILGFSGGGYQVSVVAGYGVVLWWLLLVGILSGAVPRPRAAASGVAMLGATTALAVFGAISLGWSGSSERGLTEVVRLVVFGGSLLLGMVAVAGGQVRALVGGVLTGLVLIAGAGVLSRLQPDLFSGSQAIADGLGVRERLSWPLNYWNGMGAVSALALPLGVAVAVRARTSWTSALAAAGLPLAALALVMTLSRGGVAAALVGLVVLVLAVSPRLVVLRTMVAPAVGSAVLIAAMLSSAALRDANGDAAQASAGQDLLPLILLVVLGVALVQAGWHLADRSHWTPRAPRTSRRAGTVVAVGVVLVLLVGAVAAGAPGRIDAGWQSFKDSDVRALNAKSGSVDRLSAVNGAGRYEEWSGAVRAFRENAVGGIGLGGWDAWWSPRRVTSPPVRNAHSQPLEIAAELGVLGIGLFLVLVLTPIGAGVRRIARGRRTSPYAAVVVPSLAVFVVSISVDWSWQLSAIPVAVALLAAAATSHERGRSPEGPAAPERSGTVGLVTLVTVAVLAVASIGTLAVAMIAPEGVARSSAAEASGALDEAAAEAKKTNDAAPFALTPLLQRALVEERAGNLGAAAAAARSATTLEPRNWRPWLVLARIETARDRPAEAVAAYRRAKALNPRSRVVTP